MKNILLIILANIILLGCNSARKEKIDLSGEWNFSIDSLDVGVQEAWFGDELQDIIRLPGSMTTNGKGNDITVNTQWTGGIVDSSWYFDEKYAKYRQPGNIKVPFWLQPEKYYVGPAWYQKTLEIPEHWENQHIELFLERCHWETRVWVDDNEIGMRNSLATPHVYDLTRYLSPGKHTISIRVDNSLDAIDPGYNSHSVADHTQSNWNGIAGDIELVAKPRIFISDIKIDSDIKNNALIISGEMVNELNSKSKAKLVFKADFPNGDSQSFQKEVEIQGMMTPFSINWNLGDVSPLWDEFEPNLFSINIQLQTEAGIDEKNMKYGLRAFGIEGTRFTINGRPIFLRGTLECAIFPRTGYPPTDVEEWERIFNVAKSHGLNHIRFHSWCPPEAAFEAADALGVYLQVECSSWANQSTTLGDGRPIDQFIYDESERIVKAYGNHPSFCMMAYGNEPGGRNYNQYLTDFLKYWKGKDNRRVYTGGSGWPILDDNEYHVYPAPRIQAWGAELNSLINSEPPTTNFDWSDIIAPLNEPVVSHEIGQWCVYPNFEEIPKYDGVLKPKNFEIFQETLNENGLGHLADSFLLASGKLQALCYKADIEAALRTPGFAGFQLLDLHDFPGQGTALVGVLDPFWGEKGYISPEEYSQFCNSTVPLARLDKRVFWINEDIEAHIEVAHFGKEALVNPDIKWKIHENQDILFQGELEKEEIPIDNAIQLGQITQNLSSIEDPKQLTLTVQINDFENSWNFWVFPEVEDQSGEIYLTNSLDDNAIQKLERGGKVLLSIPESVKSENLDDGIGFSSIFWNTAWTRGQKPHSLGILCDPDHPAFSQFPTEYHSNWQWWDAMTYSNAIILDDFPTEVRPLVRVIDDWVTNQSQALLLEVKVGEGKLLISGIDFFNDIENRPAGQQLLQSLKNYMEGDEFDPKVEVDINQLNLF